MRKEYDFAVLEHDNLRYVFRTAHSVFYEVRFKATPYLFENKAEIADQIYELVIERIKTPVTKVPPDILIPITVAAICKDFFSHQQERILLYLCETADFKHTARAKKFDGWFREFNDSQFLKIDAQIPDTDVTHYLSLIFRWDHPYLQEIITEFKLLANNYGPDK
ncbi:DUF6169 family protein [Runella sp.]|uniref:DUF6169 family protein n=1 Tax=Runella sp. TaxID=1960881 RepID=UPI003D13A059